MNDDARVGPAPQAPPGNQVLADDAHTDDQVNDQVDDQVNDQVNDQVDAQPLGEAADQSADETVDPSAGNHPRLADTQPDHVQSDDVQSASPDDHPSAPTQPPTVTDRPGPLAAVPRPRPPAPRPGPPSPSKPSPSRPSQSRPQSSVAQPPAADPAAQPDAAPPTASVADPPAVASEPELQTTADTTPVSDGPAASSYGRVAEDGTVYVRTGEGERSVGQVPDATPDEALEFFVRRFTALELEVSLLDRRIRSGALSPDDAGSSIKTVRATVAEAHAVGDLDGLLAKLDALSPLLAQQRARRRADRAKQSEATRSAKEQFVGEAERLAEGNDWRGGVNRFRTLLDEWKTLPRLDRATDDALWHRFSSARTQYTRRRKAQFAQQAEKRESARTIKDKIIAEAELLVGSTEWGPTTGEFRELMTRWKAAGPAPREIDEELWRRFRGIQDAFFAAKQTAMSEQDTEFRENQQAKEALLVEGEQLLPVRDLEKARSGYRDLLERWSAIGKVPRDAMRPLETRLRVIETAVRDAEEDRWRRTNPEARARAEETAAKLQAQISSQEERATKAAARGDTKAEQTARDSAATYREWLAQAERAVDDFSEG